MIEEFELKVREKGFIIFSVLAILFLSAFGAFNSLHSSLLGLFEILTATILALNLTFFLFSKDFQLASNIFLATLVIFFPLLTVISGTYNTGIFWIYLFPLIISFFKRPKEALKWIGAFTAILLLILVLNYFRIIKLPYSSEALNQALVVYFAVSIIAYFHSKLTTELLNNIHKMAVRDPLTGLYNRAFALSYLSQELEKLKRGELQNVCLAYVDLDNFKLVNDLLGHQVGDMVLSDVADILQNSFRRSDLVARLGGDEFVVICTNCNTEKIESRLKSVKNHIEERYRKFNLSMSYGLASAPQDGKEAEHLIKIADEKMYRFKKENKKRLRHHEGAQELREGESPL
ncbi:GGDEF domain-containing protein [Thermovibrio ammonificans]|uniref:diguanylate cyclase n=1 Tax=Thermovibrio ammonificans (strain DSM 15698 / JCM 12110 / HB-1) TaxID=648996 RepID=E8T4X8_THEA1|nr:GGDEF domain-containing protein [Thermovibrio ammonificans]ADU97510.1 diguanylate cyclase [Thermovibrio ammonificans HB-1]